VNSIYGAKTEPAAGAHAAAEDNTEAEAKAGRAPGNNQ